MYKSALIVSLLMVSCTKAGDFCDLAEPLTTGDAELAAQIVERDRPLAVKMNTHNALVKECP